MATSNRNVSNCKNPKPRPGHGHEHEHGSQPIPTFIYRNRNIRGYALCSTVKIELEDIGLIIGHGGLAIKSVEHNFNVKLRIDKENLIVRVHGNIQSDVENACNFLRKKIDLGNQLGESRGFFTNGWRATAVPIDWNDVDQKSQEAVKAKWANFPPLKKKIYDENDEVAELSAAEVGRMREENKIMASLVNDGNNDNNAIEIPNPVWTFEHCFGAYPDLLAGIKKQGFTKPTPIQAQAWPILLKGHDMIGISRTGSGKSLAFLLPALIHTEGIPRQQRRGPSVLVLAASRVLAVQIGAELRKLPFDNIKSVSIYGGGSRKSQTNTIDRGAEILISTPGRLNDLIMAKVIDATRITLLILDEADQMFKMGFELQIRRIVQDIRPDRQTVMMSSTWPPYVHQLAQSYMKNPIQVCIGSMDLFATHNVKQIIEIVSDDNEKYRKVIAFIENMTPDDKAIIFCGSKERVDALSIDLSVAGYMTDSIHSSRKQHDREYVLFEIKTGIINVLVGTNIASRGLDIEDLSYIIHYDMPHSIEAYVNRVSRIGRASRIVTSIAYLTRDDSKMAQDLIQILNMANQSVPYELQNMASQYAVMMKQCARYFRGNRRNNS